MQGFVLMGTTVDMPLLKDISMTGDFLNAIICLYGERYEEAIVFADKVLCRRLCHEAMFIKSRALMMLGFYDEADKVNSLYNNDEQNNGDGIVDKKWLLNIVETNRHIGDPVVEMSQRLLKICPRCYEAIVIVREELLRNGRSLETDDCIDYGELVEMFNNKEVTDADFMAALKAAEPEGRDVKMLMFQIRNLE